MVVVVDHIVWSVLIEVFPTRGTGADNLQILEPVLPHCTTSHQQTIIIFGQSYSLEDQNVFF